MNRHFLNNLKRDLNPIKVLYVEDEESVRRTTLSFLEHFFSTIYMAKDGREGLEVFLKDSDINLVITDIEMPHLSGLEMAQKIKSVNQNIPIVVLSAYDDKKYLLNAISTGIDGYLLKPIDMEKLVESLSNIKKKYFIDNLVYLYDDFLWNSTKKELFKQNEKIKLTKNELNLLELLIEKSSVVSMEDIHYLLFEDLEFSSKRVRNLISRLNVKLDTSIIESIYGMGYQIKLLHI